MTQRLKSVQKNLYYSWQQWLKNRRFASTIPAQSLCWLSSISLLSGGLVFAQTETSIDNIVPTVENSQPTVKPTVIPKADRPEPDFAERRARLSKRLHGEDISQKNKPTPVVILSRPHREISQGKPTKIHPQTLPERLPAVAQKVKNVQPTASKPKDDSDGYIDPTVYTTDHTTNYQPPSSVVLTERSSGCRTVLPDGVSASGKMICTKHQQTSRVASSGHKSEPSWLRRSETASLAEVPPVRQLANDTPSRTWHPVRISSTGDTKSDYHPHRFIPSPSEFTTTTVSAEPIAPVGGTLPPPMAEGNIAPRPSTVAYNFALASVLPQIPYSNTLAYAGGTGMIFPLTVPAPITSVFGWRIHPITGERRFHAGTDLGASFGTPILAAAKGQVESADWMGGYGLAVVIDNNSAEKTLYGHMSEIFVHPGQWVDQGTVIGRVGSTGLSTGPHLHFEIRHLTQDGWVAVDPGVQLQVALNQLVESLQTPQVAQKPGG